MKDRLRILVLCDLHFLGEGQLNLILGLDYDVCLILGDIDIPFLALARIRELVQKPIFAVGGNHDTRDMYVRAGIPYVHGKVVTVNGWRIAGIEGSNRYKSTPELCMLTQEESLAVAEDLAEADILISHDACFERFGTSANRIGLKGITRYIQKNGPILHLHGHHHVFDRYWVGNTLCLACYRAMMVEIGGPESISTTGDMDLENTSWAKIQVIF